MVDTLAVFPFLKQKLSGLKRELPLYLSTIVDLADSIDCLDWWKSHAKELPMWSYAAWLTLLMQPSSAASERVFSILNSSFKINKTILYKIMWKPVSCCNKTKVKIK